MLKITSNATMSVTYATSPKFIRDTLEHLARKAHALHSVTITVERVVIASGSGSRPGDNTTTTPVVQRLHKRDNS